MLHFIGGFIIFCCASWFFDKLFGNDQYDVTYKKRLK